MCAIFGFVSKNGRRPKVEALAKIVRANIQRGPHAFGFAWIDSRGRLRMYKQTGPLTDQIGVLAMARDAVMLIGHLRYATHGDYRNNLNNHPHPADGGWIVHNGVVRNYARLLERKKLMPITECDSEVLGLLVEASAGKLLDRMAKAARMTEGPLAMLGLWARPSTLVAVRRGNPLHIAHTEAGIYLGTLAAGLPGTVNAMADNQTSAFTVREGKVILERAALPASRASAPAVARGFQFSEDDAPLYCGG